MPDPQSRKCMPQSDQVPIACDNHRKFEMHTGLPVSSHWLPGLRQDFSQGGCFCFPMPLLKIAWGKEGSDLNKVTLGVQASLETTNPIACTCFLCWKPGDGSRGIGAILGLHYGVKKWLVSGQEYSHLDTIIIRYPYIVFILDLSIQCVHRDK